MSQTKKYLRRANLRKMNDARLWRWVHKHPIAGGMATFTPTQPAYRLYEDGTESGSSPIANQDIPITRVVDSDSKVHIRMRVDETGGASGATTDDWKLQFSTDGGSNFSDVTTTSTGVKVDTGSSLTDAAATTDRAVNGIANPGSGVFVASQQEEGNGEITNFQLTASNFTEMVFAVLFATAEVSNGQVYLFRVVVNGSVLSVSTQPSITISKTVTGGGRIFGSSCLIEGPLNTGRLAS